MRHSLFWEFIIFRNIFFVVFLLISGCGDLVEESGSSACNNAIDARNYDLALSVCSSRKDKASAYLGRAGLDIINLIKSTGSSVSAYIEPAGVTLGTDDAIGANVMNVLQLSVSNITDNTKRAAAIENSKYDLDNASALLQPYLSEKNPPLNKDEILLNTFAISFAMQLDQVITFDNATTSQQTSPTVSGTSLSCPLVTNASSAGSKLVAMDGHIWSKERDGIQCTRIKNAIDAIEGNVAKAAAVTELVNWVNAGGGTNAPLPDTIKETVCEPFESLTNYLTKLVKNIAKLSLSGDNTEIINNANSSSDTLMKTIGCYSN